MVKAKKKAKKKKITLPGHPHIAVSVEKVPKLLPIFTDLFWPPFY